jgi:hypothetical protein
MIIFSAEIEPTLNDWLKRLTSPTARGRSWIRKWHLGDSDDPAPMNVARPQDMVVANNFCHMQPPEAENCSQNMA